MEKLRTVGLLTLVLDDYLETHRDVAEVEPTNTEIEKAFNSVIELWNHNLGYFACIRLHRDDIEQDGWDVTKLSDSDMQKFANEMGEGMMPSFWEALSVISNESYKLPRKKDHD